MIAKAQEYLWVLPLTLILISKLLFLNSLPLFWPDEALFSSTASSFASTGIFSTPVLFGLIPDMEIATLWNSPLFMYLLSFIYQIGGESIYIARGFSTILALIFLFVFIKILKIQTIPNPTILIASIALVLDLTFIRSANTGRMDMLTLLWVFVTIGLTIKSHSIFYATQNPIASWKKLLLSKTSKNEQLLFLMIGFTTGLAAMSHPIAVLLIPVLIIYIIPRIKPFLYIIIGSLIALAPWLYYIFRFPTIFISQFSMQLKRKQSIFDLFGGDTGGAIKVYLSQYGGGKLLMVIAAIWICLSIFYIFYLAVSKNKIKSSAFWSSFSWRHAIVFLTILFIVILSSEGWYALYVNPFLLLFLSSLTIKPLKKSKLMIKHWGIKNIYLFISLAFTSLLFCIFTIRETFFQNKTIALQEWQTTILHNTKHCKSIYLRLRPDPYFLLRSKSSKMEILEFIPGKLKLPVGYKELSHRYDTIQCFLLNDHMSWEPILQRYFLEHSDSFIKLNLEYPLFENTTLWHRKNLIPKGR